jgi:BTB/POZ domain
MSVYHMPSEYSRNLLMKDPSDQKPNRKVDSPIIQIRVGPERKYFAVHKAMLTEVAEHFSNMFNGGFAEAREGSAEFPEDDPDAWELLIEWAYKGELPSLGKPTTETTWDEEMAKAA